ncbi:hypothetical protein ACIOG4_28645 [Streptomyces microflavus]|uniref:hypothetical protein n=1 Tax=Streptomyces microflavus TaxID=1919 RepID=UPI0037F637C2
MKPEHEMQQVRDHYDGVGRALAAILNERRLHGTGWSHETVLNIHGHVRVFRPDGMGFFLIRLNTSRKGTAGRRLTIGGLYPSGWDDSSEDSITVDKDRPVPEIANDIARRLLPGYVPKWQKAMEEEHTAEKNRRARILMNRRLEAELPGLSSAGGPRHPQPDRTKSYWNDGSHSLQMPPKVAISGSTKLSPDAATVAMEMSNVPAELALTILGLLRSARVLEGTIVDSAYPAGKDALATASRVLRGELTSGSDRTPS